MTTKFLPARVVVDQFEALQLHKEKVHRRFLTFFFLYIFPVLLGIVVTFYGSVNLDVSSLLAAVAVYTGLIFNLAFHVFDKSIEMRRNPFNVYSANEVNLADRLYSNVIYTVLVGLIVTSVLSATLFFKVSSDYVYLVQLTNGAVAALLLHLLVISGLILRQFRSLRYALKP